jgi:hypothetical protein
MYGLREFLRVLPRFSPDLVFGDFSLFVSLGRCKILFVCCLVLREFLRVLPLFLLISALVFAQVFSFTWSRFRSAGSSADFVPAAGLWYCSMRRTRSRFFLRCQSLLRFDLALTSTAPRKIPAQARC